MVTFTDFWPRLTITSFWIAVSLVSFHSGPYVALIYWGGIHFIALYELQSLLSVSLPSMIINMLTNNAVFLLLAAPYFGYPQVPGEMLLPLAFVPFAAALIDSRTNFWKSSVSSISYIWITITFHICFKLTTIDTNLLMGVLTVTWIMDAGAYFSGHLFGRTPLLTRISPRKTVEGTIGGALITFLTAHIVSMYVPFISHTDWMVVALISSTFGHLGDLFESMFKRALDVKDSGSFMGKEIGGLLDRMDSVLFAVVFVNAYLAL